MIIVVVVVFVLVNITFYSIGSCDKDFEKSFSLSKNWKEKNDEKRNEILKKKNKSFKTELFFIHSFFSKFQM